MKAGLCLLYSKLVGRYTPGKTILNLKPSLPMSAGDGLQLATLGALVRYLDDGDAPIDNN